MNKPKVLIHVVGGVAHWESSGDVDIVVVDEDNIRAGDAPVCVSQDWEPLLRRSFDLSDRRFVGIENT